MSIFSKIFGSSSVVESVYDGVDKAWLTSEEGLDYKLKFMKAYEPFKVTQRLLALIFSITYCLCWIATFVMTALGMKTEELYIILNGDMGSIVLAVVGFYFLGGAGEGLVNRFNDGKKPAK
jgi:hypothetical protein